MTRNSRQTIAPHPFTCKEIGGDRWREVKVELGSDTVCMRYLLSKCVFTDETFTQVDAVCLFQAYENCARKIQSDPGYRRKYGSEVFTFRAVIQSLDTLSRLDPQARLKYLQETYGFYRGKIFSRRYYYAVEGQAQSLYRSYIKTRFPKKPQPKSFIGKGYGDHGTAKNPSYDGNPAWQEVGLVECRKDGEMPVYLEVDFHKQYQVHSSQILRGNGLPKRSLRLLKVQSIC